MDSFSFIYVFNFLVHCALFTIAIMHRHRARVHTVFSLYLGIIALWSLCSLLLATPLFNTQPLLFGKIFLILGIFSAVSYYHFLRAFLDKPADIGVKAGYGLLFILIPLAFLGYLVDYAYATGTALSTEFTPYVYPFWVASGILTFWGLAKLIQQYNTSRDALVRNRISYIFIGFILMGLSSLPEVTIPSLSKYPMVHFGYLINASFLTYAILRYQLLDIRIALRRGIVYTILTVFITATYLVLLFTIQHFFHIKAGYTSLAVAAGVALLLAISFNPLRIAIQGRIDRQFHRGTYDWRQVLLNFSNRLNGIIELDQLADNILTPVTKAIHASYAALLLPDGDGHFTSRFYKILEDGKGIPPIELNLRRDSPIVTWLTKEERVLYQEQLGIVPQFKGLWEEELRTFANVELFFPLKSRGRLVGVLVLGKKYSGLAYSPEDIDLIVTMAEGSALAIENAQLYDEAKERALTDDLTGLYNRRCFYERLGQEISRSSRFGNVFCLLMIDLDHFKAYNDRYGHVAGDSAIKKVGECIKTSIRNVDLAFRYGGDEFAVVLPGTTPEDGLIVAERIRSRTESEMINEAIRLTISSGVASWPADGAASPSELVKSADVALYASKKNGGNQSSLFSSPEFTSILSE